MTSTEPSSETGIHVEIADRIATIWLDRVDKRNAVTYDMWKAIGDAADALAQDRSVRVVVVRGRGDHFCAGADIASLGQGDDYEGANRRAETALASLPQPTIAFLRGACVGGGCQLAFACDLRIADDTLRTGITPARLGIVYPSFSVERAVRTIGPSATKHLLFSAELIDAGRALRIGLVDEVHSPDDAETRLAEFTTLLAHRRSAMTQQASKELVDAAALGPIPDDVVARWDRESARGIDVGEGINAFLERRDPTFTWDGPAS